MVERIQFYTDEHVAGAVVRGLRLRGVVLLTTPEAKRMGKTDEEHLDFARETGRVLFTQDDDFLALHAAGTEHAGIVYAPQHTPVGRIVLGLLLVHGVMMPSDMLGRIEFI